ncbi:MAG TPA: DUF2269 family protein [Acidimicrobiia bacterium]
MGITSTGYRIVLVLHIFCAIVGFGAVYLNAIYGAEIKKRRGPDALAVYEANYRVSHIGEFFIYGVFVFGLALVGLSDKAWKFSQTWVWLAVVLYLVGIGLSHGVLLPAVKRMGALMREMVGAGPPPAGAAGPPPQAAEMAALGKRVGMAGATLDVLMVVILCLMVWKPGA